MLMAHLKAAKLASKAIAQRADMSVTDEEREIREHRLVRGPKEFRGLRKDGTKS